MNFITESLKKQGFLRIYIIKKELVFPAFPGIKKAAKKPAFSGEERPEKTGKKQERSYFLSGEKVCKEPPGNVS